MPSQTRRLRAAWASSKKRRSHEERLWVWHYRHWSKKHFLMRYYQNQIQCSNHCYRKKIQNHPQKRCWQHCCQRSCFQRRCYQK